MGDQRVPDGLVGQLARCNGVGHRAIGLERQAEQQVVGLDGMSAETGRLLARPVEPLGGCIEICGLGIVRQPFETAAIVRLVIDLCESLPRYPEEQDKHVALCGVMVPRVRMQAGAISADIAMVCLSCVCNTVVTL